MNQFWCCLLTPEYKYTLECMRACERAYMLWLCWGQGIIWIQFTSCFKINCYVHQHLPELDFNRSWWDIHREKIDGIVQEMPKLNAQLMLYIHYEWIDVNIYSVRTFAGCVHNTKHCILGVMLTISSDFFKEWNAYTVHVRIFDAIECGGRKLTCTFLSDFICSWTLNVRVIAFDDKHKQANK